MASVSVGKPAIRSAPKTMSGRSRRASRAEAHRIGPGVAPLHALEDHVVAGLQRQVQVRHQPRLLGDGGDEVLVGLHLVDGGEAQALELRHLAQDVPHELARGHVARQTGAVVGDVDAGEHDLGVAGLHQPAHLGHHLARRHRARRPAAEGDDAEGAAVVAAVLHLDVGARALLPKPSMKACAVSRTDMMSLTATRGLSARLKPRKVSACIFSALPMTRSTSGMSAKRSGSIWAAQPVTMRRALRVLALELADGLRGLAHGLGGDRAGVDDDRIAEPGRCRMAPHHLRLVGVEPAAQRDDAHRSPLRHVGWVKRQR